MVDVRPNRYRIVAAVGHPLSPDGRSVREHRKVLYDKIGPGGHPCHYCGNLVFWQHDLVVDHVDEDKANNDLSNLVPSCSSCNAWKHHFLVRHGRLPDGRVLQRRFDTLNFSEYHSFKTDEYDPWEFEEIAPAAVYDPSPRRTVRDTGHSGRP